MNPTHSGYYRQPSIHGDTIVFVCETDLWTVSTQGGTARRLTAHQLDASWPFISPDGRLIAFSAMEEGATEVYVVPIEGGQAQRLTYFGANNLVCGWSPDGSEVIFSSTAELPFSREPRLWQVTCDGGIASQLRIGPARRISFGDGGSRVISRREQEIARWKRYKGGTKGDLWVDTAGGGDFQEILKELKGNLGHPCWVGDRIYFLADLEGHGNLYAAKPDGSDIKRCTHHERYYTRAATTDGKRIVYQCGAEIFVYDPADATDRQIEIQVNSTKPQLTRKFVSPTRYLNGYSLHPNGHLLSITTRGKAFVMGNWEREVHQIGEREGVRYRLSTWLHDGERLVTVSDQGGEEGIEIHTTIAEDGIYPQAARLKDLDIGRVRALSASPTADVIAVGNHRSELILVDLAASTMKVIDKSLYSDITQIRWSPDGRYLTYSATKMLPFSQIFIADTKTADVHEVTRLVGDDCYPCFDPEGRYLYFLSARTFDPVYDTMRFDLGFPKGVKPYVITLRKDLDSPFDPAPRPFEGSPSGKDNSAIGEGDKSDKDDKSEIDETSKAQDKSKAKGKATPKPTVIDFEGLADRILAFPVEDSRLVGLSATKDKIFYLETPVEGALAKSWASERGLSKLRVFDLETKKDEVFAESVSSFSLSRDGKSIAYRAKEHLRVVKTNAKPDNKETKPGRISGYVNLERLRVSVLPKAEWQQMFREMWRLQRDHFWTTDMSNIDWSEVYERYLPILDKVASRSEFSDFAWEVHGELGTSHAYEMGGDVKAPPSYTVGKLGADFAWSGSGWAITRIPRGDSWDTSHASPLAAPGVNLAVGDEIVAVDGVGLSAMVPLGELLVHRARVDVALTIRGKDKKTRKVIVKPLASDVNLRYRDWVETNRTYVHAQTKGRIGYVHVPDMGARGYSEFFRYYMPESARHGLIVDVRYNGGGHVSQFLLEKLSRRRMSYTVSHHNRPYPEPHYAVEGPMVCITNEQAGSDGDIFSHSFKLLGLGPLIGKRTWGGVVGIDGKNRLVDGTMVTQPEYSTWFKDVGWAVENYGTDPDEEVDITPQDWSCGVDPQLQRAIELTLEALERDPPKEPRFDERPNLARPRLLRS